MRQRDVFRFWLPLYASWLLMTAEGPLVSAAVNRLPGEVVMLAALGVVIGLAVFIESPIINLLATATALVEDRASYRRVQQFTIGWMIVLAGVAALVTVPVIFDALVRDALRIPDDVARWVRPGLLVMIPWPAAIAWRRFLQGILVRAGRPRAIAAGTAARLAVSAGLAFGLAAGTRLPGIYVGVLALVAGVLVEAIFASWVARPAIAALPQRAAGDPLTLRALLAFHMPLAWTSVLTLAVHPLVSIVLARLDRPTLSLAAWPLVFQLTLAVRSAAFALPEMVIALQADEESTQALRRFSWLLAAVTLSVMLLLSATPLAEVYLRGVQSATPEVADLARLGIALLVPLPTLVVVISWLRGDLMRRRETLRVKRAMFVRIGVFVPLLVLGLVLRWPGLVTACWAIDLSVAAELAFLMIGARRLHL